ncbi:MAG: hypothetical protein KDN18_01110 [Verrucomicrobiae bacterium]|nr:hypothetical protein [Verrucomicrobiae bacterium]
MKKARRFSLAITFLVLMVLIAWVFLSRQPVGGGGADKGSRNSEATAAVIRESRLSQNAKESVEGGASSKRNGEDEVVLDVPRYVNGLIQPIGPAIRNTTDSSVERSMPITIDREELGRLRERIEKGEKVTVEMAFFERTGEKLDLDQVEDLEVGGDEGFALKGSFQGQPGSVGVLVDWKGSLAGTAMLYGRGYYRVRTVPSGYQVLDHVVKDVTCINSQQIFSIQGIVDRSFYLGVPEGYTLVPKGKGARQYNIDVFFAYTVGTIELLNNKGEIHIYKPVEASSPPDPYSNVEAAIIASLAFTNSVHSQSGSFAKFGVSGFYPNLVTSDGDADKVLNGVTEDYDEYNSSVYGELNTQADKSGADRLCVVANFNKSVGIARAPHRIAEGLGWRKIALNIQFESVCSIESLEIVICHELGHSLGGMHDADTIRDPKYGTEAFQDARAAPWKPDSVGYAFTLEENNKKVGYGTVISYPHAQPTTSQRDYYIPIFSGGGHLSHRYLNSIQLGQSGLWSDNGASRGFDNVKTFNDTAQRSAGVGNGTLYSSNAHQQLKSAHWAREYIKNSIHLGFMSDPDSWEKIDDSLTRGELVTILKKAVDAWNPGRITALQSSSGRSSSGYFPNDTDLAQSISHNPNVQIFAQLGWIDTGNEFFRVDDPASLGELVLFAWEAFELAGFPEFGTLSGNAEARYEYARTKLRILEFQHPVGDFLLPKENGEKRNGFVNRRGRLFLDLTRDASATRTQRGAIGLDFNTQANVAYGTGYGDPAVRSIASKLMVNLIMFKAANL